MADWGSVSHDDHAVGFGALFVRASLVPVAPMERKQRVGLSERVERIAGPA